MTTQQWCDLNKDGITVLPIIKIELFSVDPALWLEFNWLNLNIGVVFYFKKGTLC